MAYWVFKILLSPLFWLLWRVRVEGGEHVPRRGPAVLAANHRAFCDSLFLPLVVRRRVTFLAKAEYFDQWRTAWFFRAAGQIPVRRGGGPVSERALETAAGVLKDGRLLGVYPEGTRTRDDEVHKGRTGVARLAIELGVPIIPVGILGTDQVQPVGRRFMRPFRPVTVRFGAPLTAPDVPPVSGGGSHTAHPEEHQDRCRLLTDELMHEIAALAEREYSDCYIGPADS